MSLLRSKNIIALGLIAFLVMSFWSLLSMSMGMDGHMTNCPFMNGSSSLCQMNVSEHLNQWKQSFSMIREKNLLSLFFLLAIIFAVTLILNNKTDDKIAYQRFRGHLYKYKPEIKLFDFLLVAFSDGIIRSKIYA